MLPMSHCCSCISDYVHCTEIIFPFNATSLSIEQAQCSAQQCMSLGWGWFPARAPDSIACCPGQRLAAKELSSQGAVPRAVPGLQQLDTAPTPHLYVQPVSH